MAFFRANDNRLPVWFKWLYVAFMLLYVPIYWRGYGLQNFLWLSSIILILGFLATIFESRFLASMAAVGGLFPELLWTLDFLFTVGALLMGSGVTGFTDYVFDPNLSWPLKILAAYHLALPPLLLWLIFRLGYDSKAWIYQLGLTWLVILATWLFTTPSLNINFVFSPMKWRHLKIAPMPFLLVVFIIGFALVGTTHLFLQAFGKKFSR